MATVCIYHGADLDGKCSAAIIKHKFPDATLIPAKFDEELSIVDVAEKNDNVYVVDFVIHPFKKMTMLNDLCNLTWIDHHDTSIQDYGQASREGAKDIKGCRDTEKAACEMVWEHCYPEMPVPYTVWMLSRYDIWEHSASKSIVPFQYGMNLHHRPPESEKFWNDLFTAERDGDLIQDIISDGHTIIKYRERLNEELCKLQAFESTILNTSCICINRALCGSSVFDSVWDPDRYDVMVVFYVCNKGAWNVSLYTEKPDVHVGNIAKYFGGGGHAGAAGFRCSILPFDVVS